MGVTGIGGFFFRAKDPKATRAWYVEHLAVGSAPYGTWDTQAGPSVFAPFAADTDYFAADRQWMLNLRVDDLDSLCATLRAAGIAVTTDPEWNMPGVGRFARIDDPEGIKSSCGSPISPLEASSGRLVNPLVTYESGREKIVRSAGHIADHEARRPAQTVTAALPGPQLTAFFTSAAIRASSAAVSLVSA